MRGLPEPIEVGVAGDMPGTPHPAPERGGPEFVRTLFQLLEEFEIRYCVLHSWEGLPATPPMDLDLAVHPGDAEKLPFVFQTILDMGYQPLQRLNRPGDTYFFLYFWFENALPKSLAVNIVFEHRRTGQLLAKGEDLVAGRRRRGDLWVADARTEFGYLLAKKAWRANGSLNHAPRLKVLVEELGQEQAESVAGEFFPKEWKGCVARACADESIDEVLRKIGRLPLWSDLASHPIRLVRSMVASSAGHMRGWFRPTGLFIAVLRPYGVGQSSLLKLLDKAFGPLFPRARTFHWRPQVLRTRKVYPLEPEPPRGSLVSVLFLLAFFIDYWLGYLFVVRPLLSRSTLVLFDRYYQDMLAEPQRFRYGGPMWLLRLLSHLVPPPDLVFVVISAEEETLFSHEDGLSSPALRRERELYERLTAGLMRTTKVWTGRGIDRAIGEASRLVLYQFATSGLPTAQASVGDGPAAAPRVPALISMHPTKTTAKGFARQGFAHTQRFVVLPSHNAPRWLLPVASEKSAPQGLQMYAPYSPLARMVKELVVSTMTGWQSWASPRALVGSKKALPLESLVTAVTGEQRPMFALSVGTPGLFRKLTVQVMGLDGQILGYIKLPLTEAASERLRHEAKILKYLASFVELHPYIPRLLHAGEWGNGYILFQSGTPAQPSPTEFGPLHQKFLEALWSVQRIAKPGHAVVEEVAARWRKVEPQMDSLWQSLGAQALAKAGHQLEGVNLTCGIMHGDFAPWNTRVADGRLFVFDWEWASLEAPLSWDIFHFRAQVASLLNKNGGGDLLLGQTPGDRACFLLYILNTVCQFFEEKAAETHPGLVWRRKLLMNELS